MIEKRILGLACYQKESAAKICALCNEDWFEGEYKLLFSLIKGSFLNGSDLLGKVVENKITTLYADCVANAATPGLEEALCFTLRDRFISNSLSLHFKDWANKKIDDPYITASEYSSVLLNLISGVESEKSLASDILAQYQELRNEYAEKRENGQKYIGLETGFEKIDDLTDGIRKGHLWVVGGYTSTGKTMFALNLAKGLIERRKKVAFYSLEMTTVEIIERLLGIHTGIPSRKITRGELSEKENKSLEDALKFFRENNLSVHGSKNTLNEILMSMKIEMMTRKVDCLFIDYGQLISTGNDSEYDTMRKISVDLQTFAKKNSIPIIMLSQISNESARNNDSQVIGFKGSGAIAASADLAIELKPKQNETKDERTFKIQRGEAIDVVAAIRKNRHGKIGEIDFKFDTKNGKFSQDKDL